MQYQVVPRGGSSVIMTPNTVLLEIDNWNDFSYVTLFGLVYVDSHATRHPIGGTKIGYKGQTKERSTHSAMVPPHFLKLSESFFSLGQGVTFYKNMAKLPQEVAREILLDLRDIVQEPSIIHEVQEEEVFSVSLLREYSISLIKGQFARVLAGRSELTNYKFKIIKANSDPAENFEIPFSVDFQQKPSTNIHAIIGRNGVGKTTLLNSIIDIITKRNPTPETKIIDLSSSWSGASEIDKHYFSGLVSVSFSAFDPFEPPNEQANPALGTCYFYIGLKGPDNSHKNIHDLRVECIQALINCFRSPEKKQRWLDAIGKLSSDENFARMELNELCKKYDDLPRFQEEQADSHGMLERYKDQVLHLLKRMSSGHAIVLLTITKLVATVEEKTLVLLDEPESHLHPPLLAAFIRALSDLLHDRNGVAIIATHSPVVLQEIPRNCAWVVHRYGANIAKSRPSVETFGENVGILTSEVFGLEVVHSGFHSVLAEEVKSGKSFDQILNIFEGRLGVEGRAILQTLIIARDKGHTGQGAVR